MIDPTIALQVRPVQTPSPLEAYGKAMSLQSMANQQQLQQAQLTGASQENQLRQLQLQDQQNMRQAFSSWDGKNPDDLFSLAQQKGVSPQTLLTLKGTLLDQKTKAAALDKDTRANLLAKNTAVQSALAPVTQQADPVKQAQMWDAASQQLVKDGTLTAQEAAQHPYPGSPEAVVSYVKGLNLEKWTLSQQQQGRADQSGAEADKTYTQKIANAYKDVRNADDLNAANVGLMRVLPPKYANQLVTKYDPAAVAAVVNPTITPAESSTIQHERTEERQAAQNAVETARHNRVEESQGATRTGIDQQKFNVTYGQGLTENGQSLIDARANMIANLQDGPPSKRDPMYGAIMSRVQQIRTQQGKPAYDTSDWTTKQDAINDFSSKGKSGQAALALNTLIRHTDDMIGMAQAMQNGNFVPGNALYQKAQEIFGSNVPTNYDQLKQYIVGETVKLVRGSGGSEGDVEKATAPLNRAGSPAQLMGALQTNFAVAGGKMQALNQAARKQGLGDQYTVLDQGASDIMKHRGYDPETLKQTSPVETGASAFAVAAPNGKTYHFKTKADADSFKREAGIK